MSRYEAPTLGNTYLGCLYHTLLGNGDGDGFPYFIKNSEENLWIIEPTYQVLYYNPEIKEKYPYYDFAHYLLS
jgi:hypothetical protein